MINTTIGNDLQGVQGWTQLAGILDADKTESVKNATVDLEKDMIQITVNDGTSTHTVTISAPDLGKLEGEPDKEALAKVAEDIEALAVSLASVGSAATPEMAQAIAKLQADLASTVTGKEAGAGPSVKGSSRTTGSSTDVINTAQSLFDLYELMALMVKVAQTERDQARKIRKDENLQIQQSIQNQADEIRDAAAIALGFGIASSVISGGMSIVSMIGQARTFKQQLAATQQVEMPAQNLEAAKLAASPKAAQAKFDAIAKAGGLKMKEFMFKTFHQDPKKLTPESFQAFEQDFTDRIGAARVQLDQAETAEKTAGEELVKAKNDPKTTPEQLKAKSDAYADASRATKEAKENYNVIEREFFGKLETQLGAHEAEIKQLGEQRSNASWHDFAGKKSIDGDIGIAKGRAEYLRFYMAKMKSQYASTETKNADIQMAQKNYDSAKSDLNVDTKFTSSQQMMNRWMGINQLSTTLGQFTGNLGNLLSEQTRASATEEGVEQTQHNEQLDQIKDLFSQAQTVVQAIVQLMQAVLSAENESVMKAIRA